VQSGLQEVVDNKKLENNMGTKQILRENNKLKLYSSQYARHIQ
jgi:hypothetical protein